MQFQLPIFQINSNILSILLVLLLFPITLLLTLGVLKTLYIIFPVCLPDTKTLFSKKGKWRQKKMPYNFITQPIGVYPVSLSNAYLSIALNTQLY